VSELRFHTFNPSTIEALMTKNYPDRQELEARIDTLSVAFRALLDALPAEQSRQVRSNIAGRIEEALRRPEPANESHPYALEMRNYSVALLQDGPEPHVFGD
jgi:hypothetical protein